MAKTTKKTDVIEYTPAYDESIAGLVGIKLLGTEHLYPIYETIAQCIAKSFPAEFHIKRCALYVKVPFTRNGQKVAITFSFFTVSDKSFNIDVDFKEFDAGVPSEFETLPNWDPESYPTQVIKYVNANSFSLKITKTMRQIPNFDIGETITKYMAACIDRIGGHYDKHMLAVLDNYHTNRSPEAIKREQIRKETLRKMDEVQKTRDVERRAAIDELLKARGQDMAKLQKLLDAAANLNRCHEMFHTVVEYKVLLDAIDQLK